jgi:hypothetical protein
MTIWSSQLSRWIGNMQIADQTKIIAAIKEAGNVKVGP